MAIQWFPGHMHKAQKEIRATLKGIHVVVEVLDARIPFSSSNPMLAEIVRERPVIKVLHKYDLADPARSDEWLDRLGEQSAAVLRTRTDQDDSIQAILPACEAAAPVQAGYRRTQVLVAGIPNVGKSTIINRLAGRTIAATGNEPAVTKRQQRVDLARHISLCDTPGVLWPNVENPASGVRLAITGAIRPTAFDFTEVACQAAELLSRDYPERLAERYDWHRQTAASGLQDAADDPVALLTHIGKQRGALGPGGEVDYDKAGHLLLNDLRSGKLGRLTLEHPAEVDLELAEARKAHELREQQKQQKALLRKQRRARRNH